MYKNTIFLKMFQTLLIFVLFLILPFLFATVFFIAVNKCQICCIFKWSITLSSYCLIMLLCLLFLTYFLAHLPDLVLVGLDQGLELTLPLALLLLTPLYRNKIYLSRDWSWPSSWLFSISLRSIRTKYTWAGTWSWPSRWLFSFHSIL